MIKPLIEKHTTKFREAVSPEERFATCLRQTLDETLIQLLREPSGEFENFNRVSKTHFLPLLSKISKPISKEGTHLREAIPAKIVVEVCKAVNEVLEDEFKLPDNRTKWLEVEKGFKKNFAHAIGAIDGKHVVMQCPRNSGSEYYNCQETYSIVLLALVDSSYQLKLGDIGSQRRISDGGVFQNSLLWKKISSKTLNLPVPCPLHGTNNPDFTYAFLADGAFALHENIMKP
nr:unnamed protein product [Callosobruchus analis]